MGLDPFYSTHVALQTSHLTHGTVSPMLIIASDMHPTSPEHRNTCSGPVLGLVQSIVTHTELLMCSCTCVAAQCSCDCGSNGGNHAPLLLLLPLLSLLSFAGCVNLAIECRLLPFEDRRSLRAWSW